MPLPSQISPIAVFDAGIGSYAIAERIHHRYPAQDILYFADRASFPYGTKTHNELLTIIRATISTLHQLGAAAVVIASNAPTIMVLDDLRGMLPLPVFGVYPPIRRALATSRTGRVAVLGVASLVSSEQFRAYVLREAGSLNRVSSFNASTLVDLVESGLFLSDPERTAREVRKFIDDLLLREPEIDTFTLSSTHLPWLLEFFKDGFPSLNFLDPADEVVEQIGAHTTIGAGTMVCLASQSDAFTLDDFQTMLDLLKIPLTPVQYPFLPE